MEAHGLPICEVEVRRRGAELRCRAWQSAQRARDERIPAGAATRFERWVATVRVAGTSHENELNQQRGKQTVWTGISNTETSGYQGPLCERHCRSL